MFVNGGVWRTWLYKAGSIPRTEAWSAQGSIFKTVKAEKENMAFKNILLLGVTALFASRVGGVDNGLAITPQMGCKKALEPAFSSYVVLTSHRG